MPKRIKQRGPDLTGAVSAASQYYGAGSPGAPVRRRKATLMAKPAGGDTREAREERLRQALAEYEKGAAKRRKKREAKKAPAKKKAPPKKAPPKKKKTVFERVKAGELEKGKPSGGYFR
ncbi:MAG: hypothetical protein ACYSTZ_00070 [Planctomycetota bacterium]